MEYLSRFHWIWISILRGEYGLSASILSNDCAVLAYLFDHHQKDHQDKQSVHLRKD